MSERYVRVCRDHGRVLEELPGFRLQCPAGHLVPDGHHATFDRVKRTLTTSDGEEKTMPRPKKVDPAEPVERGVDVAKILEAEAPEPKPEPAPAKGNSERRA